MKTVLFFIRLLPFCLLLAGATLHAHQTALSYLDLQEMDDHSIKVIFKKPIQDIQSDDLFVEFPVPCQEMLPTSHNSIEGYLIQERILWCGKRGLLGSRIWVDRLLVTDKGVVFRYEDRSANVQNAIITAKTPFVKVGNFFSTQQVIAEYTWLGVEHILIGIDHLLFVLGLLLLVPNVMMLVKTITAFTLAHTLTLGMATLGYVQVPQLYIEAAIALSILFLARELVKVDPARKTLSRRYPWVIAFLFGLLHGFGFAGVLAEIGLPHDAIPLALLFFNIGVEVGQLVFIAVIIAVIKIFQIYTTAYNNLATKAVAYAIGILSSFWLIERTVVFYV